MSGSFNGVNPSVMKLEVRYANENVAPKRKVSGGAKFASALGSFLGPVAMAASVFFPPLAIAGMAAYGMRNKANQTIMQQQGMMQQEQQQAAAKNANQTMQFIGYEAPGARMGGQMMQPVMGQPVQTDQVMNILFMREQATQQMINSGSIQPR